MVVPESIDNSQVVVPAQVGPNCAVRQRVKVGQDDFRCFEAAENPVLPRADPLHKFLARNAGEYWRRHFLPGLFQRRMTGRWFDHASVNEAYTSRKLGISDGELQGNVTTPGVAGDDR